MGFEGTRTDSYHWQTAPEHLAISPRHVDVWLTSTELGEARVRACAKTLTPSELARAQKFGATAKYREYVITRDLLRRTLCQVAGVDLAGVDFSYGAHGKPCLDGGAPAARVVFNVSHSHGLALVALTLGGRLGVDLEKIRPELEWQKLAERYFSAAECRDLQARARARRRRAFFTCWTRKEAFVKALGAGVSYGLKEFDVSVDPTETDARLTLHQADEDAGGWLLKNIPAPTGYAAAMALDRPTCNLRLWRAF